MVQRAALDRVGSFDPAYAVAGDLEFYNRVAEQFYFGRNRTLLLDVRAHGGSVSLNATTPVRYMKEEVDILPYYRRHLGEAQFRQMLSRRARERGAAHAKHLLRLARSLRLAEFVAGYRALSRVHNVPLCMMFALGQAARAGVRPRAGAR
jgi:hypothetical protein